LLVQYFGAGNEQYGYRVTMGLVACLATLLFFITFATTRERVEPPVGQSSSVSTDIGDLMGNKPCLLLFFVGLLFLGSASVHYAAVPFYFKYYVQDSYQLFGRPFATQELIGAFFTLVTTFVLIGVLMTRHVVTLLGKTKAFFWLMAIAAIFKVPMFYLGPEDVPKLLVLACVSGFFAGPTAAIFFAMYADAADYSELRTGRRSTGLVMSFSTFGLKFGWAIGGALGGWLLAAFGYIPNQEQTVEAIYGIRYMLGWIPAAVGFGAGALMFFHPLTEKRMQEITRELARIRSVALASK
jgi:GPH family glycoside/pentoside/hexuronide:cation symporter